MHKHQNQTSQKSQIQCQALIKRHLLRKLKPLNYEHEYMRKKLNKSLILSGKMPSESVQKMVTQRYENTQQKQNEKMAPIQKKVTEYLKTKKIEIFLKQYAREEQSKALEKISKKQNEHYGPLKKYLNIFETQILPSQKHKSEEMSSYEELYEKIYRARYQNSLENAFINLGNILNNYTEVVPINPLNQSGKSVEIEAERIQQIKDREQELNKQIKRDILSQIKQQYRRQKECCIRIHFSKKARLRS